MEVKELLEKYAVGEIDFCGANLRGANLCGADLCRANLRGADLRRANLCEANLCEANLCEANLCGADLRRANLCEANLRRANLCGANLCEANLCEANLCEAELPAPSMVLLANWGKVSDKLCIELMRHDAANCPNGEKAFDFWANGGLCPYSEVSVERCINFIEKNELWSPGPSKTALELMVALIKEKCTNSDWH